jgi:hypothetical protein
VDAGTETTMNVVALNLVQLYIAVSRCSFHLIHDSKRDSEVSAFFFCQDIPLTYVVHLQKRLTFVTSWRAG